MWLVVTEVWSKSFGLVTERRHYNEHAMCRHSYVCILDVALCATRHIFHRWVWYHALSLCYAHSIHVFEVQASSSSPRLPLCQISFFALSTAELAHWEKLNHSVAQSAYLMCREPKLSLQSSEYVYRCITNLRMIWNTPCRCNCLQWFPAAKTSASVELTTNCVSRQSVIGRCRRCQTAHSVIGHRCWRKPAATNRCWSPCDTWLARCCYCT